MADDTATKKMWLYGGRFYCDLHKRGIPFYFAPMDAECDECHLDSMLARLRKEMLACLRKEGANGST